MAKTQILFPTNPPVPADRPKLSREEQRARVQVLERLHDLDLAVKHCQLQRKLLLARLDQKPEEN